MSLDNSTMRPEQTGSENTLHTKELFNEIDLSQFQNPLKSESSVMTQFPSGDSLIIACGGANLGDGPENPIGSFSDSATPEQRTEAGNLLTSIDSALFRELYGATADQIADYTTDKLQEAFPQSQTIENIQLTTGDPMINVTFPPVSRDGNPAIRVDMSDPYDGPNIEILVTKAEDGTPVYASLSKIGSYLIGGVGGRSRGSCSGLSPVS